MRISFHSLIHFFPVATVATSQRVVALFYFIFFFLRQMMRNERTHRRRKKNMFNLKCIVYGLRCASVAQRSRMNNDCRAFQTTVRIVCIRTFVDLNGRLYERMAKWPWNLTWEFSLFFYFGLRCVDNLNYYEWTNTCIGNGMAWQRFCLSHIYSDFIQNSFISVMAFLFRFYFIICHDFVVSRAPFTACAQCMVFDCNFMQSVLVKYLAINLLFGRLRSSHGIHQFYFWLPHAARR